MDSKLRALKVVDLRQILSTANVSVPAKATKNDLITKIQASKQALDAYAKLYPPEDLLAPPEEVDWSAEQPDVVTDRPPTPVNLIPAPVQPAPSPVKATVPVATITTTTTLSTQDLELERRKLRAERFGIPLVELKQSLKKSATSGPTSDQLEARAQRFGTGKKRTAQAEDIDPEEVERRKKRAERFGLPVKT